MLKNKYGKWALVTGASSGIGKEFAKRFANEGLNIVLVARREARLKEVSKEISEKYDVETLIIPLDLTNDDFLQTIIKFIGSREVGVLINNAGIGSTGEFINNDSEYESKMIKLNCIVPTLLTHYFAPKMKEKRKGAIIFLGSIVGMQPTPMMSTYSATKSFNHFLGSALWFELKKYGVDVLSLNPGSTNTEFKRINDSKSGKFTRTPEEVVDTAIKSLGRKISVVDGLPNKTTAIIGKLMPRKWMVNLSGKSTMKMYKSKSKIHK